MHIFNFKSLKGALLFASVGLLFSLYVVGWRLINPLNASWFLGDPATGYMGWLFFRNQESLTFPLGFVSALGYPLGEPIAYLDSIPIAAVVLWPFRHVLPESFQYHGPWFALSSALQLYFGYRISVQLTEGDKLAGFLGGLLFMIAGAFVWRAFGHYALMSHWLILAALDFYVACAQQISRRRSASGILICFVAGGVNPYITAMALMLIGAGYLKTLVIRLKGSTPDWKEIAILFALLLITIVVSFFSLFIFGFLIWGEMADYAGEGYRVYSMNLFAPFDPLDYPSILLKKQPSLWGQYEGYNYLGLGVLLMLLASVGRAPLSVTSEFTRWESVPAWLVIFVSTFLALSLTAVAGKHEMYRVQVPQSVENVLSAFRASGRLFWPAFYLILAGSIRAAFLAFREKLRYVLILALGIQFLDMNGLYKNIRKFWKGSDVTAIIDGNVWQQAGLSHRHLVIIPAFQCDPQNSPLGDAGYWVFGKFAAKYKMTTNSFHAGRLTPKQEKYFCHEQPELIKANGLEADTAYVFSNSFDTGSLKLNGHVCRETDGVKLCTTEK